MSDITDEQVEAALEATNWRVGAAAKHLGVAKSSMYRLIDRSATLRKARDIPAADLLAALAAAAGNINTAAASLRVSPRGLKLRAGELKE